MEEIREYCAFISYRHKELDKYVAKKVHTMIERYTVPTELRKSWGSKKLGKVFRDEEELPVSSNLTDSICTALDHTNFLIVICTPDTPESIWVEREIKYFLEHHDRNRMVAVLVDGTPETSFPKYLTGIYDESGNEIGKVEPLAANLTGVDHRFKKNRLKKEAVRLYAAIMGCQFDSLWQREKRHNLNRMLALVSILAMVALIYGGSIFMKNREIQKQNDAIREQNNEITDQYNKISEQKNRIEEQNKELVEKNIEITEQTLRIQSQSEDIEKQNKEITAQYKELERREAEALIKQGELLYEKGNLKEAVISALDAVESEEGAALYSDEAEYLLSRALGAEKYDNTMRTVSFFEQENDIRSISISKDNRCAYTIDAGGYIRCVELETAGLLWKNINSPAVHRYITQRDRLLEIEEGGILIDLEENVVSAFSKDTGEKLWDHSCGSSGFTDFQAVSKDGSKIALIDVTLKNIVDYEYTFVVLDTEDGSIEKKIPIGMAFGGNVIKAVGGYSGVFSDDGKKLYGMVYYSDAFFDVKGHAVFCLDLESGEITVLEEKIYEKVQSEMVYSPFVIGIAYCSEKDYAFLVRYDPADRCIYTEEYSESGKLDMSYKIEYAMPSREQFGEYKTIFKHTGEKVLFTCENMAADYSMKDEELIWLNAGSGVRIHEVNRLNDDEKVYAFLTEDGFQHAYWIKNGSVTIDRFSDKSVIKDLVISKNYAVNKTGIQGMEMSEDVVEILISATEPKRAYILRPNKDSGYADPGWDFDFEENGKIVKLDYAGNGKLALWETMDSNNGMLTFVDAQNGKKEDINYIDISDWKTLGLSGFIDTARLWPDGKHFTYEAGNLDIGIYDLEKGEKADVFVDADSRGFAVERQKDGEILHAIICVKDEPGRKIFDTDAEYEIRWRIGNGDIKTMENPSDMRLVIGGKYDKRGMICAGRNGYILAALYSDENGTVDSFLIGNTVDGTENVIKLEGTDRYTSQNDDSQNLQAALGEEKPIFITMGKDHTLRVYDIGTGEVMEHIQVPIDIRDISSVQLVNGDSKAVIWTRERKLYVYDIRTCELVFDGIMTNEDTTINFDVELSHIDDPERNRIFFVTSGSAAMCLSTVTWEKQSEFYGISAFCPETNEIYRIKNKYMNFKEEKDGVIKVKAYTLDDLKQEAQMISKNE